MSRSGKLLAVGFVFVLVGCVALWRFATRDTDASAQPKPSEPAGTTTSEAPADAGAREEAPADAWSKSVAVARIPTPRSTSRPAIAEGVAIPTEDANIEYDSNGKPIPVANLATIRQSAKATDELVRECIAKHGGANVTGKATVTFIVARKTDKGEPIIATETTSAEEDGTTIENAELVECFHKTALAMKFPASNSPIPVWARRRIIVEKGVLAESLVVEFGRIR